MLKGAICFFAFSICLFGCTTKMAHLPPPPASSESTPGLIISETTLNKGEVDLIKEPEVRARTEAKEERGGEKESIDNFAEASRPEAAHLTPPPGAPRLEASGASPPLPDLAIRGLFLNPKKRLVVTVANVGNSPLPMGFGNLKIFIDGQVKESYALSRLSDRLSLQPGEEITFITSLTIRGRQAVKAYVETGQETRESNEENNYSEAILEGLPAGPDIAIRDLDLTDDFELMIILSNAGEIDLRSGVTLRVRIFVNGLKISDFDHFTFDVLKANFENDYILQPPYQVGISGTAKVRVSISPGLSSDDIFPDNNRLEKTFIIFPFKVIPKEKKEFTFFVPPSRLKGEIQSEKLKVELRWEGGGASLMLSFMGPEKMKNVSIFSGKSPIKVEFPIGFEEARKEREWKAFVTNLIEKKVEGHLIIRHP